jgi:hypothetical protein
MPGIRPAQQRPKNLDEFGGKLKWSTNKDVLSKSSRDDIISRLNPLQLIEIVWGSKMACHYSFEKVVLEIQAPWAFDLGSAPVAPVTVQPFVVQTMGTDGFSGTQIRYNPDGSTSLIGNFATIAFPWELRAAQKPYASAVITPGLTLNKSIIYASNVGDAVTGDPGVPWLWLAFGHTWGDFFTVCRNGIPTSRLMSAAT